MAFSQFIKTLKNTLNNLNHDMNIQEITVEELNERINNGEELILIDVREPYEYNVSNLGGTLIPLGQLPQRLDEVESYKDQEVIIYCRSGGRSARACQILATNGFSNIKNLKGGITRWAHSIDRNMRVY